MSIQEQFTAAQGRVKGLPSTPDSQTLLQLYSLYKQGMAGDVQGKRPGMLDLKGRAKHDAWSGRKGMSQDEAAEAYVKLVDRLVGR